MTAEESKRFSRWQWRTIIGSMAAYAIFYFVRKNFSFAIPGLTAEYGITKTAFGAILTIIGVVYGVSRLINGMIADRANARWHMATGMTLSAVTNIIFGFGAIIVGKLTGDYMGSRFVSMLIIFFGALLVLNNIFQGCGYPPCNRLLTHWIPPHELATKMTIWNVSHSLGAFLVAILCGYIMGNMGSDMSGDALWRARITENTANITAGMDPAAAENYVNNALQHVGAWQWTFWIPAFVAIFGIVLIIVVLRDTPKSVGLPELEGTKTTLDENDSPEEFKKFVKKMVWKNPAMWILALADFFVYIVRFAVLDWGPTFLQESRGLSPQMAALTVAIFECFGMAGMMLSGWISDKLFGGRSQRTCVFCMLGVVLFVGIFFILPESTSPTLLLFILAFAGFCIYGPQALCGVIASQFATKRAAATGNGLVGLAAYLAPLVSGLGFGFVSDNFGWKWVFVSMIVFGLVGAGVFMLLWNHARDGYENA